MISIFDPQECRVVKSSRLLAKIATYLVSIRQILYSAWHISLQMAFLKFRISLDWPLTLKTQSSTSKRSGNPGRVTLACSV